MEVRCTAAEIKNAGSPPKGFGFISFEPSLGSVSPRLVCSASPPRDG